MTNQSKAQEEAPTYGRLKWAARHMGTSERHAYRLARRGDLPGVRRFGRSVRVHREKFLAWLNGESE